MENMLPGLIQTAKALAKQSLPPGSISSDMDSEMDEFVQNTTQKLFGNLGAGCGSGEAPDLGNIFSNIMSMANGGGGGFGGNSNDIYETIELDFEEYFRPSEHSVKYVAKFFDESTLQVRKKKKKVVVPLPAGIPENHRIVVEGQGHFDLKTRTTGNLIIECKLRETSTWPLFFKRESQDLVLRLPIENFVEDSFNFTRTIPHPLGVLLNISIDSNVLWNAPLGFRDRTMFKIPGMGFPAFEGHRAGDLVIKTFFNPELYTYEPTTANFLYTGASLKNMSTSIYHESQLSTLRTSNITISERNFTQSQTIVQDSDSSSEHDSSSEPLLEPENISSDNERSVNTLEEVD